LFANVSFKNDETGEVNVIVALPREKPFSILLLSIFKFEMPVRLNCPNELLPNEYELFTLKSKITILVLLECISNTPLMIA